MLSLCFVHKIHFSASTKDIKEFYAGITCREFCFPQNQTLGIVLQSWSQDWWGRLKSLTFLVEYYQKKFKSGCRKENVIINYQQCVIFICRYFDKRWFYSGILFSLFKLVVHLLALYYVFLCEICADDCSGPFHHKRQFVVWTADRTACICN